MHWQRHVTFAQLFENVPLGVALSDEKARPFLLNRALIAMLGYSADELMEKGFYAISYPDDPSVDVDDLVAIKNAEKTSVCVEKRYIRADGKPLWVRITVSAAFDQDGQFLFFIGVTEDISERKAFAEQREILISELKQQNSELEEFSHTVSHDLKSPLVTIASFADLLEIDVEEGQNVEIHHDLREIRNAVGVLRQRIDGLLKLAKVSKRVSTSAVLVDMNHVLADTLRLLRGPIDESGAVIDAQSNLPAVYGDAVLLSQVWQNLIDNALQAVQGYPNPTIRIGVKESEATDEKIFYVADNGVGLDTYACARVFELFFRVDGAEKTAQKNQKAEHYGIGLSLVQRIIARHGGRIWVESSGKQQGACFYFALPAAYRR